MAFNTIDGTIGEPFFAGVVDAGAFEWRAAGACEVPFPVTGGPAIWFMFIPRMGGAMCIGIMFGGIICIGGPWGG